MIRWQCITCWKVTVRAAGDCPRCGTFGYAMEGDFTTIKGVDPMTETGATKTFAFNLEQLAILYDALRTQLWKVQEQIDQRVEFGEKHPKGVHAEPTPPTLHDRELLATYLKVARSLDHPLNLSGEPAWVNEVMTHTFLESRRPKAAVAPKPKAAAKGKRAAAARKGHETQRAHDAEAMARRERARQGGLARAKKAAEAREAKRKATALVGAGTQATAPLGTAPTPWTPDSGQSA